MIFDNEYKTIKIKIMKKFLLLIAIIISGMGLFAQNIGDNTIIDYDGYSLEYTVTSVEPAECEVRCSVKPTVSTGITIPSTVIIGSSNTPTEIVIGAESSLSNQYIPTYEYYDYSVTQQIYTADEIQSGEGTITSVAFRQTESVSDTRVLDVYMLNTEELSFTSGNNWFAISFENKLPFNHLDASETQTHG